MCSGAGDVDRGPAPRWATGVTLHLRAIGMLTVDDRMGEASTAACNRAGATVRTPLRARLGTDPR